VAGGWAADYAGTLGSVEAYDPAADAFSFAPNLTLPRGDCEAAVIDDRWATRAVRRTRTHCCHAAIAGLA
jgi:hypothetical protein